MFKEFLVSGESHIIEPVDFKTRVPVNRRGRTWREEELTLDGPTVPGGYADDGSRCGREGLLAQADQPSWASSAYCRRSRLRVQRISAGTPPTGRDCRLAEQSGGEHIPNAMRLRPLDDGCGGDDGPTSAVARPRRPQRQRQGLHAGGQSYCCRLSPIGLCFRHA